MAENTYKGAIPDLKEFWEDKGRTKSFEEEYGTSLEGIRRVVAPYPRRGLWPRNSGKFLPSKLKSHRPRFFHVNAKERKSTHSHSVTSECIRTSIPHVFL
jgi:hypothetical protein